MTAKPLPSSKTLTGYELLEIAGRGGMGTVYRARQKSLHRIVAIKALHLDSNRETTANLLERESHTMATLNHPNVVTIYDYHRTITQAYLVMEWVEGTTLRSLLVPKQGLSIPQACHLLAGAADGLEYIHKQGILHLDFKPENVLVTHSGEVKITDFGLSRNLPDGSPSDGLRPNAGTMDYCAPEQRHGLEVDARTDVFSFAAVAYELLTGYVPGRAYVPCSTRNPLLPKAVDDVLKRGLARDPENRFQSVSDLHHELSAALSTRKRYLPWLWPVGLATGFALLVATQLLNKSVDAPAVTVQPGNWLAFHAENTPPVDLPQDVVLVPAHPTAPPVRVALPIGDLPIPMPAQMVGFEGGVGTFHPLQTIEILQAKQIDWLKSSYELITASGSCIRAGTFSGDCLTLSPGHGPWQYYDRLAQCGVQIDLVHSSDHNQCLRVRCNTGGPKVEVPVSYQWLATTPFEPGQRMLMRFRARQLHGTAQIALGPSLPLQIPAEDQSKLAGWIIRVSEPAPVTTNFEGAEVWFQIKDWHQPGEGWSTYFLVFDWPPHCNQSSHRNVELRIRGSGEVWIDDVEMFPLPALPPKDVAGRG